MKNSILYNSSFKICSLIEKNMSKKSNKNFLVNHIFRLSFICITVFVSNIAFTKSTELPYDTQCSESAIQRTKNISVDSSLTEADFCEVCSQYDNLYESYLPALNIRRILHTIPKQCFLAMALRGNQLFSSSQYVSCQSKTDPNFSKSRKLCINESYIDKIHKAWTDMALCFEYGLDRQEEIFHLINQESGGVLNTRSTTGARCLGQLTIGYVKTINNIIQSVDKKNPLNHSEIYRKVSQRCPMVKEKLLKNINSITCQTSMDPYTCLFYTFYGLEKNHKTMQKNLNSNSDYMGNREFPPDITKKYKLPIKLNEMLHIRGTTKNGNEINWVIWDDSELYHLWEKIDDTKPLKIKKIPLFKKQDDIEQMFNYWAHNGGQSLVRGSLIKRVERLKRSISSSCKANSTENRCLARQQIENGRGIDSQLALEMFSDDLRATYPSKRPSRRKEVSEYVKNIINTNNKVFDYKEKSENTNTMLSFYQKSQPNLNEESAEEFQKQISKSCPTLKF